MIHGFTDRFLARYDGKIRAGYRDPSTGYPKNAPHFLLHDAPQLIPILGNNPKEFFCSFLFDDLEAVVPNSLAYYKKSGLVCRGDGQNAAYYETPNGNIHGLTNKPHPSIPGAFQRRCDFKDCPDLISRNCKPSFKLNIIIPQYSAMSIFALPNTSYNGLTNVVDCLQKAFVRNNRKLAGHIFRIYKKEVEVRYMNTKSGKVEQKEHFVVAMEYVDGPKAQHLLGTTVKSEDLKLLESFRSRPPINGNEFKNLLALDDESDDVGEALPPPVNIGAALLTNEPVNKNGDSDWATLANSPILADLFAKCASYAGIENTEAARIATVKHTKGNIQQAHDILKDKLKKYEKAAKEKVEAAQIASTPAEPIRTAAAPEVLPATDSLL